MTTSKAYLQPYGSRTLRDWSSSRVPCGLPFLPHVARSLAAVQVRLRLDTTLVIPDTMAPLVLFTIFANSDGRECLGRMTPHYRVRHLCVLTRRASTLGRDKRNKKTVISHTL